MQTEDFKISLKDRLIFPCFKKKDKVIERCKEKISRELDIINIIQTCQKIKAGLAAIIADNQGLFDKTKNLYY
jgi:hypothetical protein